MAKTKLTIISQNTFSFTDKNGNTKEAYAYGAFKQDGKAINFSSMNSEYQVQDASGFDITKSVEIDLGVKVFNGQVKYKDAAHPVTG